MSNLMRRLFYGNEQGWHIQEIVFNVDIETGLEVWFLNKCAYTIQRLELAETKKLVDDLNREYAALGETQPSTPVQEDQN